jgi:hypothetical protein
LLHISITFGCSYGKLATYTASHAAYDDLTKALSVLRARDAPAKFNEALPCSI